MKKQLLIGLVLGLFFIATSGIAIGGEKILFTSDRNGSYDLFVMNPDGSGVERLTSSIYDDLEPQCSSSGEKNSIFQKNQWYQFLADKNFGYGQSK